MDADQAFYAVLGQPVAHSLSPRIHQAFANALGMRLDYRAIEIDAGRFDAGLAELREAGLQGANVTLPHKEAAAAISLELSDRARLAGAVNTLVRSAAGWLGDNTDGIGLVRDLVRLGADLTRKRVLLLGAGGAARGVVPALFEAGIGQLTIVNRTRPRAERLAADLAACGPIEVIDLDDLEREPAFDLVINATSAARQGALPPWPTNVIGPASIAYDLSYGEAALPFLAWVQGTGAGLAADGLGMLVEQAAESFRIWHGRQPQTGPVLASLRAMLPGG